MIDFVDELLFSYAGKITEVLFGLREVVPQMFMAL
jgi:hypothetical protein